MSEMPRPADATRFRFDYTINIVNIAAFMGALMSAGYAYGLLHARIGVLEAQMSAQAQTQARQVDLMERWVRTDEKLAGLAVTVDKHDSRIERLERQ
ncbi:hypothetical protein [Ancylobacter vacuolatus]|uniref:Cell division protein FtsL n=1 Tax=Ancylobacter vacuolatus TaxID=223389 RepID=A0ABU0DNC9_9HYPH|nr:hypothetical protein [Ancylobacter vacuolatus]MDQ0349720.1 hypothetical protein [Ancylobacter vacuolatus]